MSNKRWQDKHHRAKTNGSENNLEKIAIGKSEEGCGQACNPGKS